MNKNQLYEMGNPNILEDTLDISLWGLSKTEHKLFEILEKVEGETLIGLSIRERLSSRSIRGFREMIKELNEQRLVAKNELTRAIGSEAVELIKRIS